MGDASGDAAAAGGVVVALAWSSLSSSFKLKRSGRVPSRSGERVVPVVELHLDKCGQDNETRESKA